MKIHALYHYPVKSLGGGAHTTLELTPRGFVDDRRWMFVDADGRFISQRTQPQLTHFRAEVMGEEELRFVRLDGNEVIGTVKRARPRGPGRLPVTVWDDTFPAVVVDDPAVSAIAETLGLAGARLVYMDEDTHRPVDPRYAEAWEEASFADGFPYLITTTASLEDLSERLGEPVDMLRFRPNIVVATERAFAEDDWAELTLGEQPFVTPKPCARCIMVTQDPQTGERDLRVLAKLAAYRKKGSKVLFGINALWRGRKGRLTVGDRVTVRGSEALSPVK